VEKYHALHYRYGLERAVAICEAQQRNALAFWFDTPADRKARLDLELSLMHEVEATPISVE